MARERSPNRDKAHEIYKNFGGNISNRKIAEMLDEDEKVIAVWKSRDKWGGVVQQKKNRCTTKKNRGGQRGNKNAEGAGAPAHNSNAEKHGLFSKYLPQETLELIEMIIEKSPLDLLWDQIMIQYAAIIRSQQIMFVTDKDEMIKELKRSYQKNTERQTEKTNSKSDECEYEWEFQFAWDRQATYLKAQSRAMGELRNMIKQYDDMLHRNWDTATEEQKLRIDKLKGEIDLIRIQKAKLDPDADNNQGGVVILPGRIPDNEDAPEEIIDSEPEEKNEDEEGGNV